MIRGKCGFGKPEAGNRDLTNMDLAKMRFEKTLVFESLDRQNHDMVKM